MSRVIDSYVPADMLNQYEFIISSRTRPILVAAHNIYEACDKMNFLISTFDSSERHEIVSVSLLLHQILC